MKPYRTAREMVREKLGLVQGELVAMKRLTKASGIRRPLFFDRNGHARFRLVWERFTPGRSLTSAEGKRLHALKWEATVLCATLALARGRLHKSPLMKHPEGLAAVAMAMKAYQDLEYKGPRPKVVTEFENDEYGAVDNPVYAMESGTK